MHVYVLRTEYHEWNTKTNAHEIVETKTEVYRNYLTARNKAQKLGMRFAPDQYMGESSDSGHIRITPFYVIEAVELNME